MKKRNFSIVLLLLIVFLMCAALYWNGNYVVYILMYILGFGFLLCHTVFSSSVIWQKIAQIIVYALIMVMQILFAALVIRPSANGGFIFNLCRLLGVMFLFIPLLVRQAFFLMPSGNMYTAPSIEEWSALSYSQLLCDKEEITNKIVKVQKAGKVLSKGQIREIVQDLPRHKCFSYINNGSLTREYFEKAQSSLNDGCLYLVLTRSKSAASEMIGLFTNKEYNHVSIAFDCDLFTIISYNGGERVEPPGLNPELVNFVELDYYRKLEFVTEITLDESVSSRGDYNNGKKDS